MYSTMKPSLHNALRGRRAGTDAGNAGSVLSSSAVSLNLHVFRSNNFPALGNHLNIEINVKQLLRAGGIFPG